MKGSYHTQTYTAELSRAVSREKEADMSEAASKTKAHPTLADEVIGAIKETKPDGLAHKLLKVMEAVSRVEKKGYNKSQGYPYLREEDVVAAVRGAFVAQRVVMIPSVEDVAWRSVRGKHGEIPVATLRMCFAFIDADTGERFDVRTVGEGMDSGDKNVYKAMTGALKYALRQPLLIPTGDDPELDSHTDAAVYSGPGAPASDWRGPDSDDRPPPTIPDSNQAANDSASGRRIAELTDDEMVKQTVAAFPGVNFFTDVAAKFRQYKKLTANQRAAFAQALGDVEIVQRAQEVDPSDFVDSVAGKLKQYGRLTDNQRAALLKTIDKHAGQAEDPPDPVDTGDDGIPF